MGSQTSDSGVPSGVTKVVVKLFDSDPITVMVPEVVSRNNPKFMETVAEKALQEYRQKNRWVCRSQLCSLRALQVSGNQKKGRRCSLGMMAPVTRAQARSQKISGNFTFPLEDVLSLLRSIWVWVGASGWMSSPHLSFSSVLFSGRNEMWSLPLPIGGCLSSVAPEMSDRPLERAPHVTEWLGLASRPSCPLTQAFLPLDSAP